MAIDVKDATVSAGKWRSRAGAAATDYQEGAIAAAQRWQQSTVASAQNFQQAISAAGMMERFRRGVQRAGAEKFSRKISSVGAGRFSPGVAAAESDYQSGVSPYLDTIRGLTLPPRRPRGDPTNIERVRSVTQALNARRLAMLAGS